MNSVVPEETEVDSIDPDEYAALQQKIDDAHDQFLIKHLNRVWPKNFLLIVGILQILLALAFVGVDLPIVLMYAPRWQIFAGCWAFLFALIAGIMTIRSTKRSTWLKLNWTLAMNVIGSLAATAMLAFDLLFIINPNVCVSLSGCNYLSYTFSAAKPYYIAQTVLGAGFIVTVVIFVICYIKFGLGGSKLFDNIQKGWADPLREPMLEPYKPPPPQPMMHPMYAPGMFPPRPPPFMRFPAGPMRPPMFPGMMPVPGVVNPRIMLRPRPPNVVGPMGQPVVYGSTGMFNAPPMPLSPVEQ